MNYVGNEKIVNFLNRAVVDQSFSHAYLFTGPEKLGKLKIASEFARSALCLNNKKLRNLFESDNCVSCRQFEKEIHPDFHVLKKSDDKLNISVNEVRNFQNNFNKTTLLGHRKVGIITQADALNSEGANALLKTLEEPAGDSIIILITSNSDVLPATIASRCQIINFNLVSKSIIKNMLVGLGCDRSKSDTIASIAMGKPGLAYEYFINKRNFELYLSELDDLINIYIKKIPYKFIFLQQYLDSKKHQERIELANELINRLSSVIHDSILIKIGLEKNIVNTYQIDSLKKIAHEYSFIELLFHQKSLYQLKSRFSNSINPLLALENYFLKTKTYV